MLHALESWTLDQAFGLMLASVWVVIALLIWVWRDR